MARRCCPSGDKRRDQKSCDGEKSTCSPATTVLLFCVHLWQSGVQEGSVAESCPRHAATSCPRMTHSGQQNITDSPGLLEREGEKASGRVRYCAAAAGANGAGNSRGPSAGMAAEIDAFQEEATRSVVTS